eukprot:363842-Chlamydomonas_euryale.AAC.2
MCSQPAHQLEFWERGGDPAAGTCAGHPQPPVPQSPARAAGLGRQGRHGKGGCAAARKLQPADGAARAERRRECVCARMRAHKARRECALVRVFARKEARVCKRASLQKKGMTACSSVFAQGMCEHSPRV